ncbi:MAG TPA: GNAT family N-acetyltransferase [Cyclobacteriaceae bacterium]|nr:GNAT family N-acetyltransferase [Cyclobacteriaceae bacterium]
MHLEDNISIRAARRADFDSLMPMMKALGTLDGEACQFTKKDFLKSGFGKAKSYSMLVALYKGTHVGYISFHPGYDMQSASKGHYIIDLFVEKSHRQKRIGKRLMSEVARISTRAGGKWLSWHVRRSNAGAIAFYKRLGAHSTNSLQFVLDL